MRDCPPFAAINHIPRGTVWAVAKWLSKTNAPKFVSTVLLVSWCGQGPYGPFEGQPSVEDRPSVQLHTLLFCTFVLVRRQDLFSIWSLVLVL